MASCELHTEYDDHTSRVNLREMLGNAGSPNYMNNGTSSLFELYAENGRFFRRRVLVLRSSYNNNILTLKGRGTQRTRTGEGGGAP